MGATLLAFSLAACGGSNSSPVPSAAVQQPATTNSGAVAQQDLSVMTTSAGSVIHVTSADRAAATTAKVIPAHLFFPYGKTPTGSVSHGPKPVVYPGDLSYFGGHVITNAQIYNAYVDSSPAKPVRSRCSRRITA